MSAIFARSATRVAQAAKQNTVSAHERRRSERAELTISPSPRSIDQTSDQRLEGRSCMHTRQLHVSSPLCRVDPPSTRSSPRVPTRMTRSQWRAATDAHRRPAMRGVRYRATKHDAHRQAAERWLCHSFLFAACRSAATFRLLTMISPSVHHRPTRHACALGARSCMRAPM
jgi:hypothetical protein